MGAVLRQPDHPGSYGFPRGVLARGAKFFRPVEDAGTGSGMEATSKVLEERDIRRIGLRVASRGINVDHLTFGELIYMEAEASDRDQVLLACAAQNPKMLPKPRVGQSNSVEKLKASASKYFTSTDKTK